MVIITAIIGGTSCIQFNLGQICADSDIREQLHEEVLPEFVLNGQYYCLPCPLSEFINNGWENKHEGKLYSETTQAQEINSILLEYKDETIKDVQVIAYVDTDHQEDPDNTEVKAVSFDISEKAKASDLVLWQGICTKTSKSLLERIIGQDSIHVQTKMIGLKGNPIDTQHEYEYLIYTRDEKGIIAVSLWERELVGYVFVTASKDIFSSLGPGFPIKFDNEETGSAK